MQKEIKKPYIVIFYSSASKIMPCNVFSFIGLRCCHWHVWLSFWQPGLGFQLGNVISLWLYHYINVASGSDRLYSMSCTVITIFPVQWWVNKLLLVLALALQATQSHTGKKIEESSNVYKSLLHTIYFNCIDLTSKTLMSPWVTSNLWKWD